MQCSVAIDSFGLEQDPSSAPRIARWTPAAVGNCKEPLVMHITLPLVATGSSLLQSLSKGPRYQASGTSRRGIVGQELKEITVNRDE